MKHLISLFGKKFATWLAKRYHALKLSSPVMYTSIGGALLWIQTQLIDPSTLSAIAAALPPQLIWAVPVIQILPTLIGIILSPHTSERVKAAQEAKAIKRINSL